MREATIFNKVNNLGGFNLTGAEIAKASGLDKSIVSRFLNGKTNISLSNFLKLIKSMPTEFQEMYWNELLGIKSVKLSDSVNWKEFISIASYSEIEEILNAIADRWSKLAKTKEKELMNVG
jgi:transcriptional regulator with XRE-family HTH domain